MADQLENGNPLNMPPRIFESAEYVASRIVWNSHLPDGNASEVRSVVRVEIHNAIKAERERCAALFDAMANKQPAASAMRSQYRKYAKLIRRNA